MLIPTLLLLAPQPVQVAIPGGGDDPAEQTWGHSEHGAAFDEGPRQKPWIMESIGHTPFPITTRVPEVQQWFDQGNALMHSFWFFEAERSFRWCLHLDPDCAMAWWGLARAIGGRYGNERMLDVLAEAVALRDTVTDRERRYIDTWQRAFLPAEHGDLDAADDKRSKFEILSEQLEMLVLAHPSDIEARALLGLNQLFRAPRFANELVLRSVLDGAPDHTGAHHYMIHNWDGPDGARALDSCEVYGKLAANVGHANHMPGHIYSRLGMWHEGALWMERATRVEKAYMAERLIFPFHNWNYAHNVNYLTFTLEQLGQVEGALSAAWDLLAAPLDPKFNNPEKKGYSLHRQGLRSMRRVVARFERWDLLNEGSVPFGNRLEDEVWEHYLEGRASLDAGEPAAAADSLEDLNAYAGRLKEAGIGDAARDFPYLRDELQARLELERGEELAGLARLSQAAERQWEDYDEYNDPPSLALFLYTVLGDRYLATGNPVLALRAYERTLEKIPNDPFALAGMAQAHHAAGDESAATIAFRRLKFIWSAADPGLRWWDAAKALGLDGPALDLSPRQQRRYDEIDQSMTGPTRWSPPAAPLLDVRDPSGERRSLDEFRGKKVLLVFYLGGECVHCIEQLTAIAEREHEFAETGCVLLAVSADSPETNTEALGRGDTPFLLLSDYEHENAKRFRCFDDFEGMDLHSTVIIDAEGNLHWARTGGEPFMDLDFLLQELGRVR